ncbi:MAG: hypothetical protein WBD13_21670 [Burkholderiaceae bacterium]
MRMIIEASLVGTGVDAKGVAIRLRAIARHNDDIARLGPSLAKNKQLLAGLVRLVRCSRINSNCLRSSQNIPANSAQFRRSFCHGCVAAMES